MLQLGGSHAALCSWKFIACAGRIPLGGIVGKMSAKAAERLLLRHHLAELLGKLVDSRLGQRGLNDRGIGRAVVDPGDGSIRSGQIHAIPDRLECCRILQR